MSRYLVVLLMTAVGCYQSAPIVESSGTDAGDLPTLRAGVWEGFGGGEVDLEGHTLFFSPATGSEREFYQWSVSWGRVDVPIEPGTGDVSTTLTLDDDDFDTYYLGLMPSVSFFGVRYELFHVSSNAFVTFGEGSGDYSTDAEDLFAHASIALLKGDFDPTYQGRVTVDEFEDRVAVTFEEVPAFDEVTPNTFQLVLYDDASIELHYIHITTAQELVAGISNGLPGATPSPVNFVRTVRSERCFDDLDNDEDGLTDCDDPDCEGDPTYCASTESSCVDGIDNDRDALTDCADADCSDVCTEPGEDCYNGTDDDGDGYIDCGDRDCQSTPRCHQHCLGFWERFDEGEGDLTGWTLGFDPVDDETYEIFTSDLGTEFRNLPGEGEFSQILHLDDDDFAEFAFSATFFGVDYGEVYIGSNGYLTFGQGDSGLSSDPPAHYAIPAISALRGDLNPSEGEIIIDDYGDRLIVTYDQIPWFGYEHERGNSFQIELWADGFIALHYLWINYRREYLVGLSNGCDLSVYPDESDLLSR